MSAESNPIDLESLRGHTPGPWSVDDISGSAVLCGGIGGPFLVAKMAMHNRDEGMANARLIAAAPDLLAELTERRAKDALVAELVKALTIAVRQNSHDMLMTGEELRICEAALAAVLGKDGA